MELTFGPRDVLMFNDARIIFRNFAGAGSKFNREGDRNFAIIIDSQELADTLTEEGWNVKIKPPRDEQDEPFMYLPVKVKFSQRGPKIFLRTGEVVNELIPSDDPKEDMVKTLDEIDILTVDLDVRPYDWEINGKTGRTAYLQGMEVTQVVDRFAARHSASEEDCPF